MSSKSKPKTQSKTKAKATGGLDESPPAHGRMLPDRKIIISLAKDFDRADVVKESIGEDLKECKASAKDRGVNIKALTDAWKATKRARDDAIGAAIFEEDRAYYLEVLGFDKMMETIKNWQPDYSKVAGTLKTAFIRPNYSLIKPKFILINYKNSLLKAA